jgi:hypothetical protein
LEIRSTNIETKDFRWSTSLNLGHNANKILKLDEVIVTGYGTFKKSAYAGSASIVKTDAVKDVPNVSFQQMLEGAAPGVSVNTGSGIPGSSTSIRIRGMGSFNASNSPLYAPFSTNSKSLNSVNEPSVSIAVEDCKSNQSFPQLLNKVAKAPKAIYFIFFILIHL